MSERKAIAGINPETGHCCMIAEDCEEAWLDARNDGLIVVPVTAETAREIFGQDVQDLYAIARKAETP